MNKLLILLMLTFSGSVFAEITVGGNNVNEYIEYKDGVKTIVKDGSVELIFDDGYEIGSSNNSSTDEKDTVEVNVNKWSAKDFVDNYNYSFDNGGQSLWLKVDSTDTEVERNHLTGWCLNSDCFDTVNYYVVKTKVAEHTKLNLDKQLFSSQWSPKFTKDVLNAWSDGNTGEGVKIGVSLVLDVKFDDRNVLVEDAFTKVYQYETRTDEVRHNWYGANGWTTKGENDRTSWEAYQTYKRYIGVDESQIIQEIAGDTYYSEDGLLIGAGVAVDAQVDRISQNVIGYDFVVGNLSLANEYRLHADDTVIIGRNFSSNTTVYDNALDYIYVADRFTEVPEDYKGRALSAEFQGGTDLLGNNIYNWTYGAARIAGSAAIVKDAFDLSDNNDVAQILLETADNYIDGAGFLNLERALSLSENIE